MTTSFKLSEAVAAFSMAVRIEHASLRRHFLRVIRAYLAGTAVYTLA